MAQCVTYKKAFCFYCRHASKQNWILFSKTGEQHTVFTETGFQNWKKAIEKFNVHEGSLVHREAVQKWAAQGKPTVASQLSTQLHKLQEKRRLGLLLQLEGLRFLSRQAVAILGHEVKEGNLHQLLLAWSHSDAILQDWIKENKYTSHQSINELLSIMGQSILRSLLATIKNVTGPAWFSIIADEATDICNTEQLNLFAGLVTTMKLMRILLLFFVFLILTLFNVIKDLLIRCNLPLELCRGQAYDGAANMQGRRTGVAARFLGENKAAIPVHCFAHSLNLCLQGATKTLVCL